MAQRDSTTGARGKSSHASKAAGTGATPNDVAPLDQAAKTAAPGKPEGTRPGMLRGMRIVDLSTVVFGPYATQILADLGAEVVKVEPAGGDSIRVIGTPPTTPLMSPVHLRLNRGKRSVDWDLKSQAGREAMRRLVQASDIVLHNIRADAIARVGLDYESVRAIKPDIIYVHCTGFGEDGPYAGLQAYDDIIQSASGVASLLPRVDGNPEPRFFPMLFADKVSGLHAAYATLAAVVHKLRTGEGQHVEVPMFETLASFNLLEHLCDMTFVPPTGPACYPRQVDPARQPMRTADGYIAIAPYVDARWVKFFDVVGRPDVLLDPRFIDAPSRRRNTSDMYRLAAEVMPQRTTDDWLRLFAEANIPAMRINSIEDLLVDPHLKAVGLLREREHPTEGTYLEVRPPVRFSGYEYADLSHAASSGQHSAEVASELGVEIGAAPGASR